MIVVTHALISISDGKVNKATTISVAALMLSLTVYMGTYTQYRRVHTHQHSHMVWQSGGLKVCHWHSQFMLPHPAQPRSINSACGV